MTVIAPVVGPATLLPKGAEVVAGEVYYPVDLDGLVVDTILDFHLYIQAGHGHFVLFRSPNREFTVVHRNRLLENGVPTLYVRAGERSQYAKFLEHNLGAVLANPEVPERKKATLLYGVSRNVVKDAFEEPRSSAIVPRTRRLATETVDFVLFFSTFSAVSAAIILARSILTRRGEGAILSLALMSGANAASATGCSRRCACHDEVKQWQRLVYRKSKRVRTLVRANCESFLAHSLFWRPSAF